ncbi:zinc ribbon domain-containing protein [Bacteroides uniformis]|uniref:zinc ribbon domain-containing protein n=1 Tax=Bacteroides uniformis TaxID=820 RepID=UPI003C1300FB
MALHKRSGGTSFGMFLVMLEYRCKWYGVNLVRIDRFALSSRTYSNLNEIWYIRLFFVYLQK